MLLYEALENFTLTQEKLQELEADYPILLDLQKICNPYEELESLNEDFLYSEIYKTIYWKGLKDLNCDLYRDNKCVIDFYEKYENDICEYYESLSEEMGKDPAGMSITDAISNPKWAKLRILEGYIPHKIAEILENTEIGQDDIIETWEYRKDMLQDELKSFIKNMFDIYKQTGTEASFAIRSIDGKLCFIDSKDEREENKEEEADSKELVTETLERLELSLQSLQEYMQEFKEKLQDIKEARITQETAQEE